MRIPGFLRVTQKLYRDGEDGNPVRLIPVGRIVIIQQVLGQENADVYYEEAKGERLAIETVESFAEIEEQLSADGAHS